MLLKLLEYQFTFFSQCHGRELTSLFLISRSVHQPKHVICCHVFLLTFSLGRPTNEFPHPLARVPQSAAYWVMILLSAALTGSFL